MPSTEGAIAQGSCGACPRPLAVCQGEAYGASPSADSGRTNTTVSMIVSRDLRAHNEVRPEFVRILMALRGNQPDPATTPCVLRRFAVRSVRWPYGNCHYDTTRRKG